MQSVDIIEAFIGQIENLIIKQWKHSGYIDHYQSDCVVFNVDGVLYEATLKRIGGETFE